MLSPNAYDERDDEVSIEDLAKSGKWSDLCVAQFFSVRCRTDFPRSLPLVIRMSGHNKSHQNFHLSLWAVVLITGPLPGRHDIGEHASFVFALSGDGYV